VSHTKNEAQVAVEGIAQQVKLVRFAIADVDCFDAVETALSSIDEIEPAGGLLIGKLVIVAAALASPVALSSTSQL
jgi:hypothetical protein